MDGSRASGGHRLGFLIAMGLAAPALAVLGGVGGFAQQQQQGSGLTGWVNGIAILIGFALLAAPIAIAALLAAATGRRWGASAGAVLVTALVGGCIVGDAIGTPARMSSGPIGATVRFSVTAPSVHEWRGSATCWPTGDVPILDAGRITSADAPDLRLNLDPRTPHSIHVFLSTTPGPSYEDSAQVGGSVAVEARGSSGRIRVAGLPPGAGGGILEPRYEPLDGILEWSCE